MSKFKMELTWHNCETCPPNEPYNSRLLITDGGTIAFGKFGYGQFYVNNMPVNKSLCWWADIDQTVRNTKEFYNA
jgi:hypothetical protein